MRAQTHTDTDTQTHRHTHTHTHTPTRIPTRTRTRTHPYLFISVFFLCPSSHSICWNDCYCCSHYYHYHHYVCTYIRTYIHACPSTHAHMYISLFVLSGTLSHKRYSSMLNLPDERIVSHRWQGRLQATRAHAHIVQFRVRFEFCLSPGLDAGTSGTRALLKLPEVPQCGDFLASSAGKLKVVARVLLLGRFCQRLRLGIFSRSVAFCPSV